MLLPGAVKLSRSGGARERFLSAAAAFFLKTAHWPTVAEVERILEGWGDRVHARKEAKRLCRSLGHMSDGHIVLTVRGLQMVRPKNPVLRGFKSGLDLALERFQGGDWTATPTLAAEELAESLDLNATQAECVMTLMAAESLVEPRGDDLPARVDSKIREFRAVETIPEYIDEQSAADRRRCIGQWVADRRRSLFALVGPDIRKIVLGGAAATLLAAFALWLGGVLFPRDPGDPPSRHRPPAGSNGRRAPSWQGSSKSRQAPLPTRAGRPPPAPADTR